jgi:transposase InsO family protein
MQRIQAHYTESKHTESKRIYGAPKIQKRLRKESFRVSLKRVQRLMRRANLRSIIVKKYRPQSSQGPVENRKNVLAQDFTATKINQKWVADITYIHTIKEGWCYLASVMDLCTRKIVGYFFFTEHDHGARTAGFRKRLCQSKS